MRSVPVGKKLYREITMLNERESLVATFHCHVPPNGIYHLYCGNSKPIKCKIQPTETRKQRKGKKTPLIEVILTRK